MWWGMKSKLRIKEEKVIRRWQGWVGSVCGMMSVPSAELKVDLIKSHNRWVQFSAEVILKDVCLFQIESWKSGTWCNLIDDINISKERLEAEGGWATWKYRKMEIGEAEFASVFSELFREGDNTAQSLNIWSVWLDYHTNIGL